MAKKSKKPKESVLTLTTKIQIYPTPEQEELLLKTREVYQAACNAVSSYVSEHRILNGKQIQEKVYDWIREEYDLSSMMTCSVCRLVDAKYRREQTVRQKDFDFQLIEFKNNWPDLVWNRDYSMPG